MPELLGFSVVFWLGPRSFGLDGVLPVRQEMSLQTDPVVKLAGALVIVAVAVFFFVFW
jgi:hypothetical protein